MQFRDKHSDICPCAYGSGT